MSRIIHTIGHSTRPEKDFLQLLKQHQIDILVDIRTIPRSRWNPQFNKSSLEKSIPGAGMEYLPVPALGGLREPSTSSMNLGIKDPGLRGYADHMQTADFDSALRQVIKLSQNKKIALMCAEAHFEKCHRRLTSDALTARKIRVVHILDSQRTEPHVLTPSARVKGTQVSYPLKQSKLEF